MHLVYSSRALASIRLAAAHTRAKKKKKADGVTTEHLYSHQLVFVLGSPFLDLGLRLDIIMGFFL